jgi:hypothetical protein
MSDDREKELDAVQRELSQVGAPYIEKPEELDIHRNGLCFLDVKRLCTPACMAFVAGSETEPDPGMRCRLLRMGEFACEMLVQLTSKPQITGTVNPEPPIYPVPNPLGKKP